MSMSTIIKAKPLRLWVGGAALALSTWATIMLAMPVAGPAGRPVAVVGDKVAAIAAIQAAGGQILEYRRGATLARSDRSNFTLALYRAGASLVLEGRGASGCFRRTGKA